MSGDRYEDQSPESALRDLMSLLALPALWPGRDGTAIVALMAQAIERIVPLDICSRCEVLNTNVAPVRELRLTCKIVSAPIRVASQESKAETNLIPSRVAKANRTT